jgi:hypothetical protein
MAQISAHGKTKVGTFKNQFKEEYGVGIRIYNGQRFAAENATLASIRSEEQSSEGAIKINGNMLVGNLEQKFLDVLGIKVQIEDAQGGLADNGVTLTSLPGKSNSANISDVNMPAKKSNKTAIIAVVIIVVIVVMLLLFR